MGVPAKLLLYVDMFSAVNHASMDSTALGYEQSIVGYQVAERAKINNEGLAARADAEVSGIFLHASRRRCSPTEPAAAAAPRPDKEG